jgi:excisionase family DNA binding protein
VQDATYKPPEGFLTMAQAQARLGVSKATAQRIVRDAKLPAYADPRNKRVRLFKVADVERLTEPVLLEDSAEKARAA